MTQITYDTDDCTTDATLGFDVVRIYDGKVHRAGTYSSQRIARETAERMGDTYHVITR